MKGDKHFTIVGAAAEYLRNTWGCWFIHKSCEQGECKGINFLVSDKKDGGLCYSCQQDGILDIANKLYEEKENGSEINK